MILSQPDSVSKGGTHPVDMASRQANLHSIHDLNGVVRPRPDLEGYELDCVESCIWVTEVWWRRKIYCRGGDGPYRSQSQFHAHEDQSDHHQLRRHTVIDGWGSIYESTARHVPPPLHSVQNFSLEFHGPV